MQYFTRKQVIKMIQVGIQKFGLIGFSDGTGVAYKTLQNIVNGETKTITEKVATRLGLEVVYRKNQQESKK